MRLFTQASSFENFLHEVFSQVEVCLNHQKPSKISAEGIILNADNLMKSSKKISLYFLHEGNLLREFQAENTDSSIKSKLLSAVIKLMYTCGTSNFIHNDLNPNNIFYTLQTVDQNHIRRSSKVKSKESKNLFSKMKSTKRIRSKDSQANNNNTDFIQSKLAQKKILLDPKSNNIKVAKSSVSVKSFINESRKQFLVQEREKYIKLTFTSLGLGKTQSLTQSTQRQQWIWFYYLKHISKSKIKIKTHLVDENFDFYKDLRREFDSFFTKDAKTKTFDNLLTPKTMTSLQSTKSSFKFNRKPHLDTSISESRDPSSPENAYDILPFYKESTLSVKDNLHKFFFESDYLKKASKLSKEHKQEVYKANNKIKKKSIRGTIKYASVLSFLKVNDEFLRDIESIFYSYLDSSRCLPKTTCVSNQKQSVVFNSDIRLENPKVLNEFTVENITSFKSKQTFISDDQIDILLSILVNVYKNDFLKNESCINLVYNLRKKRLQTFKEIEGNTHRNRPQSHTPSKFIVMMKSADSTVSNDLFRISICTSNRRFLSFST